MVIGYIFESVLGLIFASSLAFLPSTFTTETSTSATKPRDLAEKLLKEGCTTFFNCAVFFTASIQIACVVVLIRRDFGISANGLGGLTTQITWAIALLCMLPLLYPMVILGYIDKARSGYRLFLFCGCWLLFFYTFISQMIGVFAPTQIGEGAGEGGTTIITDEQWSKLTTLCLKDVNTLTEKEQKVLSSFGAAGSIVISIYGFGYLLGFIAKRQWQEKTEVFQRKISSHLQKRNWERHLIRSWILLILVLTVPQIWGVLRLREIQKALARATGNFYVDNQWTFGQVVAVMLFAPVFTEVGYMFVRERGK
jgi:hypothetical protein